MEEENRKENNLVSIFVKYLDGYLIAVSLKRKTFQSDAIC